MWNATGMPSGKEAEIRNVTLTPDVSRSLNRPVFRMHERCFLFNVMVVPESTRGLAHRVMEGKRQKTFSDKYFLDIAGQTFYE